MSGVDINPKQRELRDTVQRCLKTLRDDIRQGNRLPYNKKMELYSEMALAAHELHMSLEPKPKHHRYTRNGKCRTRVRYASSTLRQYYQLRLGDAFDCTDAF